MIDLKCFRCVEDHLVVRPEALEEGPRTAKRRFASAIRNLLDAPAAVDSVEQASVSRIEDENKIVGRMAFIQQ